MKSHPIIELSEHLFSADAAAASGVRERGLRELSKALDLSNAYAWGRAIGKVLDISPSEMYFRAAVESFSRWIDDDDYDSFIQELMQLLGKISVKHLSLLCVAVSGLDLSQSDVQLFRTLSPLPHRSREVLERILQGLQETLRSKSEAPNSKLSALEVDALAKEINSLIELQRVLELLPIEENYREQAKLCFSSDSDELKETLLIRVLLSPSTTAESIKPLHKLLLKEKDLINSLLELSIEAFQRLRANVSGLMHKHSAEVLLKKALIIFDDAETARFHAALNIMLAGCSDEFHIHLELALVLREYDPGANEIVTFIESKLLLSQLSFSLTEGNLLPHERIHSHSVTSSVNTYDLSSGEQRSQLLSEVLDTIHPVNSHQLRLILKLMRAWGMSCAINVDELTSLWTNLMLKPEHFNFLTNRSLASFAKDWQNFLSVAKAHCIEDVVVEALLMDVGVVNGRVCNTRASEEHVGFITDPIMLRDWCAYMSDANQVIIDVALGGESAESALARLQFVSQLDECLLLFIPVMVSAEALYRFPLLHILVKSMMDRYTGRIMSRATESFVVDDSLKNLCLHDCLRIIGSNVLPMVFSPIPILGKLCTEGNVYEAALLYW